MRWRLTIASMLIFFSLLVVFACSKEKLSQLVDKTKQNVSAGADQLKQGVQAATDTAKEQLHLAGSAQLQLDQSVQTSGCYANWIELAEKRPNVLQIRSYSNPVQESFPSLMIRAGVGKATKTELIGQVFAAQLYVQAASDAPIYYTAPGSPIQLKIVSLDDNSLTGVIVSGTLVNTHRPNSQAVTGTLSAVWQ